MFYRLHPDYILRGWEHFPHALIYTKTNRLQALTREEFQTLLLCDGEAPQDPGSFTGPLAEPFRRFLKNRILLQSDSPLPVSENQQYRYFRNRYVYSVFWSITGRCNYRCRHCYMDAPGGALGELPTEQALSLIDQMAQCGVLRVDLTGGEPFVRRDFWQLVDRFAYHNIIIDQIYTNGWLLTEKVLDEFEKRSMHPAFSLSFDGVGWHDWMRGVKGAEEAALRALRLCRQRGFLTNVEMCIHKGNQHLLPQTLALLRETGITGLRTGRVSETELWCRNADGNAMTEREYVDAMIEYIPKFFEAKLPMNVLLSDVVSLLSEAAAGKSESPRYKVVAERFDGTEECSSCYLCGAVRKSIYITPEGRLLPCMPMTSAPRADQEKFPLIRDIGLQKGLSDSFFMEYVDSRIADLLAVNKECAACPHRYKCGGGCRANALLGGDHDLMGTDRTLCMLWNEGYVEKIRQTTEAAIAKYCTPNS